MSNNKSVTVKFGGFFGCLIAAFLSWCTNHSVGYAIVHLILGWLYVIYWYACTSYSDTVKFPF